MNRHTFRALLQKCLLLCIFFAGDICASSSLSSSDFRQDGQTNPVDATFTNELVKKAYTEFLGIKEELNKMYQIVTKIIHKKEEGPKLSNVNENIQSIKSNNEIKFIETDQTVLALNASLQHHPNIYQQAQIITKIIETLITTSQIVRTTAKDIYNLMSSLFETNRYTFNDIFEAIENSQNRLNSMLQQAQDNLITAQAEQLIQDAYFSPEMQSIVLSYVHRPFRVNVVTGKVQDLPTTQEIINANSKKDIRSKINALHAAQEALELAQLTAKLDVLIQHPKLLYNPRLNSSFMPSLDPDLQQAFTEIQNKLTKALDKVISKRSWTDYAWEWIPTPLQDAVYAKNVQSMSSDASQSIPLNSLNYRNIHDPRNIVTIPDALLYNIIKQFDYKQRMYADEIADLLFKQMFVAQQQVSEHNEHNVNLQELCHYSTSLTIDAANYLYNHCNTFNEMIQKIENSSTDIKKRSHPDLLHIRKAVQTAMYIANKNSNYYIGMIIPAQFTWLIDGALSQLMAYDNQLDLLCKDPDYGALRDDQSWSWTAKIIAGVAVIGTAVAVGYGVKNSAQAIGSYVLPQPAPTPTKNPANSQPLATSAKAENNKQQETDQGKTPRNFYDISIPFFRLSTPAILKAPITLPEMKFETSQANDAINPHVDKNPDTETEQIDIPHILNSIDPQEALATAGLIGAAGTGVYTINSKIKAAQAHAAAAKKENATNSQAQSSTTPSAPGNTANSQVQSSATPSTSGNTTNSQAQSSATPSTSGNATNSQAQSSTTPSAPGNTANSQAQSSTTPSAPGNTANSQAQSSAKKSFSSQATKNNLQKLARTGAKGAVAAGLVGAAGYYLADNFIPQGTYENYDQNQ